MITGIQREELHRCAQQLADERLPPGWDLVPSSHSTRVAHNEALQLYYKEFLPRSPLESLKALVRGSRASRARKHGDALRYAGLAAPENVAWGKLDTGREYLFTRAVAGEDVGQWLCALPMSARSEKLQTRRELLIALGTFIGRMHALGFIHGDLRPGNVLAHQADGQFHFTLIDNERTVQHLPPPGTLLLKNLMQLNMLPPTVISRTDRMRFFRAWHQQNPELTAIEARLLATEAYHWAMGRLYEKGKL